jgi:alpha-L-rhamnosidase
VTEWSPYSPLEIALLENSDWTGRMITVLGAWPLNPDLSARPLSFHRSFDLPLNRNFISIARLYITSHGVYSARMNGQRIGDHCLRPGCQSYHKRLHYQIYDVKDLLVASGLNTIEVEVAAGWFASAWTWARNRFIYGEKLGALAQLEIFFADAPAPWVLSTDYSWNASTSALISSEIYDGEVYDQRLNTSANPGDGITRFQTEESPIPVSRLVSQKPLRSG